MITPAEFERHGEQLVFTWPIQGLGVGLEQFRESAGEIKCEVSVTVNGGHLHWSTWNLSSSQTRASLAKTLALKWADAPWADVLEHVAVKAVREYRRGECIIRLTDVAAPQTLPYLMSRLLPERSITGLFADGESTKTLFAGAVALAVVTGEPLPRGLAPTTPGPVLILDWETDREDHVLRMRRLSEGLGLSRIPDGILYRRSVRALHDDAQMLAAEVSKQGIQLVVVDSIGAAAGDDPSSAEAALRTTNAARSLGCTILAIGHVNRTDRTQSAPNQSMFGSIFWRNSFRAMWQLSAADDTNDERPFALHQRKANGDRREKWPLGFRWMFTPKGGPIYLESHDVAAGDDLATGASIGDRIKKALSRGAMSTGDIKESLGASEDSVSKTLRRLRDRGIIISLDDDNKGGRGRESMWGLAAWNGDIEP